jgi:hypothetical protein
VEEEVPGNGGWAKDGEAEEPARVAGESAASRKGTRRSEKAKVSEEALLTRSLFPTLPRDSLAIVSLAHSTVTGLRPGRPLFSRTRTHSDVAALDQRLYTSHHNLRSPEL